jgi:hypothetical protein
VGFTERRFKVNQEYTLSRVEESIDKLSEESELEKDMYS